ncbi:MAG: tetratricopeptide repeat protein [bacterium]|nr:tetratricopeptide repeat protein [bacterium]
MGSQQANLKGSVRLGGYLRKLRSGYGYSLRRVEERAKAEGGEIDNSQLSRYEKGICYPSFDKLRILANVFNVSIQSFSDVVDLESFEELKPLAGDPSGMVDRGIEETKAGNNGRAFALFERAVEMLLDAPASIDRQKMMGRAKVNQALALHRLGKLSLAEQELRGALRDQENLSPELRARSFLLLANIHADQGDGFLSEMEAEKAYEAARDLEMDQLAAMALHTLGRVLSDQGRPAHAIQRFRESARLYAAAGNTYEAIRVKTFIGSCYIELGKSREGVRLLRSALDEARGSSHRRLEAVAWSNIGDAYFRMKDWRRARSCFRESDALALYNNEKQTDVLFFNAFHEWRMAQEEDNPTREKIAFGRLKALRSSLERRLPEVEVFDDFVEGGRRHA